MCKPVTRRTSEPSRMLDDQAITSQPANERALELLRRARPYQSIAGRMERVFARLDEPPRRPRVWALRLAVAVAAVLVLGALTSAVAGGGWTAWVRRVYEQVVGQDARDLPSLAPLPSSPPVAPVQTAAPPPASTSLVAPEPEAAVVQAQPPAKPPRNAARLPSSDDVPPIIQAMRALRIEHDPVRARALVAPYLARHPDGELAQEALAISIEAAAAHHDEDASALAARYLRLYPTGAFSSIAKRTLRAPSAASQP